MNNSLALPPESRRSQQARPGPGRGGGGPGQAAFRSPGAPRHRAARLICKDSGVFCLAGISLELGLWFWMLLGPRVVLSEARIPTCGSRLCVRERGGIPQRPQSDCSPRSVHLSSQASGSCLCPGSVLMETLIPPGARPSHVHVRVRARMCVYACTCMSECMWQLTAQRVSRLGQVHHGHEAGAGDSAPVRAPWRPRRCPKSAVPHEASGRSGDGGGAQGCVSQAPSTFSMYFSGALSAGGGGWSITGSHGVGGGAALAAGASPPRTLGASGHLPLPRASCLPGGWCVSSRWPLPGRPPGCVPTPFLHCSAVLWPCLLPPGGREVAGGSSEWLFVRPHYEGGW